MDRIDEKIEKYIGEHRLDEKVSSIEPMINMYNKSKDYLVPFGIKVYYSSGESKSYAGNPSDALLNTLTKKQIKFVNDIIKAIKQKKKMV